MEAPTSTEPASPPAVRASDATGRSGPVAKSGKVARSYTPSEKARALKRVAEVGISAASRELGISRYSLRDWRRKVERAAAGQGDSPTTGPDPADIERRRDSEILEIWREHPDLGPSQIRNQFRRQGVKVAVSTVRRVMEDAPRLRRRPRPRRRALDDAAAGRHRVRRGADRS